MLRIVFIFLFVLFISPAFAQQEVLQKIVSTYEIKQPLGEEVFVHTDKSFYVCGEVMWFKVYVLNEQSHLLQGISHTAYVELVNEENKSVLKGKVRLDSGGGDGSFFLPVSLPSGNYVLRAYTNWMKNDPSGFFEKPITVINTRKEMDTSVLVHTVSASSSDVQSRLSSNYSVEVRGSELPSVIVKTKNATDPYLYLIIHQQHKVSYSAWLPVQSGEAAFQFNPSALPAGASEIEVLNSDQKLIYKNWYFKNTSIYNANIKVSASQDSYQPRNRVILNLQSADTTNHYHLSASVYHLSELNQPEKDYTITSFLQEIPAGTKGSIHSNTFLKPANYNYPLAQALSPASENFSFLPEMNGMLITVVAKKSGSGTPAADVPVYLSVEGKLPDVQVGKTNKNGQAFFNFRNLYGLAQLVLQTDPPFQDNIDFSIVKSYTGNETPLTHFSNREMTPDLEVAIESLHNYTVVNDNFIGSKMDSFAISNKDSIAFFGKPYKTYMLDDYKRFVTMEEVLREYVQEVNVRIRNKNYFFQTFNRQYFDIGKFMTLDYMMTEGSPLVLLDGVPVFDNNKIMKYYPLLVRKLDVMADRFHIGTKVWNGLMSFVTYGGALQDFKLDSKDVVVDFDGWQRPRIFYMPDYSKLDIRNNRIPDFRNVLYWNPEINMKSSSQLQFFTGDLTGKFVVVVQGISDDGKPVYTTATFEVNRNL